MPVILSQQPSSPAPPGVIGLSICFLGTAIAAWLSLGTIGFESAAGSRIGVLPASAAAAIVALAAAAVVAMLLRAGSSPRALSLLALVALPWLPAPVPAAFLIWSGPIAGAVWIGVAIILALGVLRVRLRSAFLVPPRAPATAGLLAFLIFGAAAWRAAPTRPGGDEPHYLILTQSLLLDGDLKIENNHRRGDYRAYYAGDLAPHVQRLGKDGEVYSVHAPGLPALVLPAFALAGYPGVVLFLLVLSAAGSALAWWIAWLSTGRADAAWFAWASVTLPVTAVFQSFSAYPDAVGGTLALTGVWALLRAGQERRTGAERIGPWFWHGAALAALPWLHSRYAAIAGGFGAVALLRLSSTRGSAGKAVAFLATPAISAVLWIGFFVAIYGRPDPSAPYGPGEMGSVAWIPGGLAGLLFDQRFGLLPYAPVLAFAFAGFAIMLARPGSRRLAIELLFVIVPYLLTVTHFAMWWGGWSAPARFFVPVLPLMVVPAAAFWVWAREQRHGAAFPLAALAFTCLATAVVVGVDRGRLAFNVRDTPALWLDWISAADLAQALPWWTRGADGQFFRDIAVWMGFLLAAVLALRRLHTLRTWHHVALAWTLSLAAMGAATTVWMLRGADGRRVAAAQLRLLRSVVSSPRVLALDLQRGTAIETAAVPRRMRIALDRPLSAGRGDRPLFDVPRMPAGTYRLTPAGAAPRGWLMIGIARDQFALVTMQIPSPARAIDVTLPVPVRGIVVRGDEDAHQSVSGMVVEPLEIARAGDPRVDVARRAVKYSGATVFFFDDRSFPEPAAFWVGGARSSSVAIQPDGGARAVAVVMRNGRVANHVTMDAGGVRSELAFEPGEERRVAIPVDGARGAAVVTLGVRDGFRPSEHDPASRDSRFLGVWVKVEG